MSNTFLGRNLKNLLICHEEVSFESNNRIDSLSILVRHDSFDQPFLSRPPDIGTMMHWNIQDLCWKIAFNLIRWIIHTHSFSIHLNFDILALWATILVSKRYPTLLVCSRPPEIAIIWLCGCIGVAKIGSVCLPSVLRAISFEAFVKCEKFVVAPKLSDHLDG